MGYDRGFDFTLNSGDDEATMDILWNRFLLLVTTKFSDCAEVTHKPYYIEFTVGEYPELPRDYRYFRRFSSKISGCCAKAEKYIVVVEKIALTVFGNSRVRPWNEVPSYFECDDEDDGRVWSWTEVYAARKAYRQRITNPTANPKINGGLCPRK